MKCICGNVLQFSDNSIKTEDGRYGEVRPVYYCDICNIVYDGYDLDCEDKYTIISKKYIKWFNKHTEELLNEYLLEINNTQEISMDYRKDDL